ncbi:MAG: radical SAM protein, partial [Clostridia bacterium]|nr:radical SAM protein [Clostridia bacterium]
MLALHPDSDNLLIRVTGDNGAVLELTPPDPAVTDNKELVRDLYCRISEFTGYRSPWGCLTGVRPTKIVNQLLAAGRSRSEVRDELTGFYCARPVKAKLALTTATNQKAFLAEQAADPSRIGIYIGIPFCPTRCVYCSFTSNSIEKYRGRVNEYLRLLRAEMEAVADLVREQSLKLESVYIGGGTPTSLSEPQFARLIDDAAELFTSRSAYLREFSVEAGRPDSITAGKLTAMRAAGVNRISINPQTMNDATLELIGRRHTAADTLRAFELARAQGFDNINADIICGLP